MLSELAGKPVRLELTPGAARRRRCARRRAAAARRAVATAAQRSTGCTPHCAAPSAAPRHRAADASAAAVAHRLNPALTFDTLVPGRANQMARTAALHVAGAPGVMYNPLFIYGGVGLGKTHLIHAVGNALLEDRPDARVLYLHAEQFISDVVKNYQRKTFDELKAKYHSLDLLLIDDVQFFAGKERTQEEFFNAFEALLAKTRAHHHDQRHLPQGAGRHRRAADLALRRRADGGDRAARARDARRDPDPQGRGRRHARCPRTWPSSSPRTCAPTCASSKARCARCWPTARFSQKDINIDLAREALKDLLSIQNRQISVENIQKTVADFYKIKVADMYSKKRPASIARPRQIAMYLAKEMTQKSLPEIGELFGGRDHTTVLHAVRKIGGERQQEHRAEPAAARARTDAQGLSACASASVK